MKTEPSTFTPFSLQTFAFGLCAGILVAGIWFMRAQTPTPLPVASAATTTPKTADSGAIEISEQKAGDTVRVDSVTVPPPGVWVAIRETRLGNDLGNVLGAVRVRGPRSSFSIPLLRPTVAGRMYAVELYRTDSGGTFDASSASVYVDFDTGARVVVLFRAL